MTDPGAREGSPFSRDYATARERFRSLSVARGFRLESVPIGQAGPAGEDLTIDAAILGPSRRGRALVVSSGLHGVEGFFGSAVQVAWLTRGFGWPARPDEAVVLLHGLDPYGFAWGRRFDEGNVDLNRNFLVEGEAFQGSDPLYRRLEPLLNPPHAPRAFNAFPFRAVLALLRHGRHNVRSAVAQGQYDFPRGLFFGGHGPAPARRCLEENLPRWLGDARSVLHVDFHTGLGARGQYRMLLEPEVSEEAAGRTLATFGPDRVERYERKGTFYQTRGDINSWCRATFPTCRYDALCAEFGTYPPLRVLSALRAENQAYHHLGPGHPTLAKARRDLLEAFAPADPVWRETTVALGMDILDRAIVAAFPR